MQRSTYRSVFRSVVPAKLVLSVMLVACGPSEVAPSEVAQRPSPAISADTEAEIEAQVAATRGLNAEYFNTLDFSGPSVKRIAANINVDLAGGAPVPGIGADNFSVRYSGEISAPTSGVYTFIATADDGVRMNVSGQTVLSDYRDHPAREASGTITLVAGERVPIELEYFERGGLSSLKLEWSGPGLARQVVPSKRLYSAASPAPAPGQTYYVAPGGNNGGPGSQAQPWKTLDKAVNTLKPGETVLIRGGTYVNDYMFFTRTGTPLRPISFKAYPGEKPVLRIDTDDGGATMQGVSYINLEGMTFEYVRPNPGRAPQSAIGISVNPGVSADAARTPRLPHHIRIYGNTVRGFPAGGINTGLSDYVTIERNTISETSRWAPNQPSAISLGSLVNLNAKPGSHNIIRANTVFNNENLLIGSGIGLDYISDGNCIIVDDTRLAQAKESFSDYLQPFLIGGAVYEPYASQTLIENNLCVNNGGRGVHVYKSDHVLVRNNTLYQNLRTQGQGMEGELSASQSSDVRFENNIVFARPGAVATLDTGSSGVSFGSNLYFGVDLFYDVDGAKMKTPPGRHIFADPQFVNPGLDLNTADFRVRSGSPVIDAGLLSASLPYGDLGGTLRPQGGGIDIGAWER